MENTSRFIRIARAFPHSGSGTELQVRFEKHRVRSFARELKPPFRVGLQIAVDLSSECALPHCWTSLLLKLTHQTKSPDRQWFFSVRKLQVTPRTISQRMRQISRSSISKRKRQSTSPAGL